MISFNEACSVPEFLRLVAAKQERALCYALYWKGRDDRDPTLADDFLVAAPVEVQGDAMVFPAEVQRRGWWLYCSDDLVRDVVDLATEQKPAVTPGELLRCLVHYLHEDAYLDLA